MAERITLIPLKERVKSLERVYYAVQKEIVRILLSVDPTNYRELKVVKIQERINALIRKLNRMSIKWVNESVPQAYEKSYVIAKTSLEILGANKDVYFNNKIHRNSIEDYIEKTMNALLIANQSITVSVNMYLYLVRRASTGLMQIQAFGPEDMDEVIYDIIMDTIDIGQARTYASDKIYNYLKGELVNGKFISKSGRNYNLRDYSKMVARTELRRAQTDAVKNTCKQYENDLVQWSRHADSCPLCAPYEGQIYSLSGKHPIYPFLDAEPPLHPNCEHDISPTSEVAIEYREART